jgi:hypothetical protein
MNQRDSSKEIVMRASEQQVIVRPQTQPQREIPINTRKAIAGRGLKAINLVLTAIDRVGLAADSFVAVRDNGGSVRRGLIYTSNGVASLIIDAVVPDDEEDALKEQLRAIQLSGAVIGRYHSQEFCPQDLGVQPVRYEMQFCTNNVPGIAAEASELLARIGCNIELQEVECFRAPRLLVGDGSTALHLHTTFNL